jgi:hypothetical protein
MHRRCNVFSVMYEMGFYIPEEGNFRSRHLENIKSCIVLTGWFLWRRRNVFSLRYEFRLYIQEDGILHTYLLETRNLTLH